MHDLASLPLPTSFRLTSEMPAVASPTINFGSMTACHASTYESIEWNELVRVGSKLSPLHRQKLLKVEVPLSTIFET